MIKRMSLQDINEDFIRILNQLAHCTLRVEEAIDVFNKRNSEIFRTYGYYLDNRLVGTASCTLEPKFIHNNGYVMYIEDVVVDEPYRKRNIGTELVQHLVMVAKLAGCYKVMLNAAWNVTAFYLKLGFLQHNNGLRLNLS